MPLAGRSCQRRAAEHDHRADEQREQDPEHGEEVLLDSDPPLHEPSEQLTHTRSAAYGRGRD